MNSRTIQFTTSIRFVTPRSRTTTPESMPAVVTDPASKAVPDEEDTSVSATAAMLFIGWTHIGTSHKYPVIRFDTPAQKRDGASAILRSRANATVSGMNVPRSPKEPDSSDRVRLHRC